MNSNLVDGEASAISIRDLTFSWDNRKPVLDIAELDIARGESVFIKGASGSGKSTLLSLIGGVMLPQNGKISVLNQQYNKLGNAKRDRFRADHIGFIFQMFNLIPYLSVLENVLLPCQFSHKRRQAALKNSADLNQEAKRLLGHLDLSEDLQQRPVTDLSVGQQQRVAVARALIGKPELVIADEPTSALDTDRRNRFLELLLQECQQQDTTLVFVSHDPTLDQHFQRQIDLSAINRASQGEA